MMETTQQLNRLRWIFRFSCLCLIIQTLMSCPLWFQPTGALPYTPAIDILFPFPQWSSTVLFPAFLGLLVLGVFKNNAWEISGWILLAMSLLVVGNIHRLQVWFYFFGLVFLIFHCFKKDGNTEKALHTLLVLVAALYGWAGLNKLNVYFNEYVFEWLLSPFCATVNPRWGYAAAIGEAVMGVGLFFQKTQKWAVWCLTVFHLALIVLLSPFGKNWNAVVLPWNVAMIGILWSLLGCKAILRDQTTTPYTWVLLPMLLPILNLWQLTPEQLSFKMYSGTRPEAILKFNNPKAINNCFPNHACDIPQPQSIGTCNLYLDLLFFQEFNTPPFTTQWTMRRLNHQLCQCFVPPEAATMEYLEVNRFNADKARWTTWRCGE